ncbi:uncharacterized protein SPPG_06294 [Spizellomyces punctatus DAOM BR117]|uniref:Major facilitator superfamily (MFS) profile domain-containing protein n=1 Tax=Spizellomyces punctatus (strain DAOM BR117) TaxID=645134 RepID=A0A0L0HD25_SPIPD|nr:uncharacterized protein SPPG_06294 [Spizellomyces punctatus DAOM BR117]KNC98613.1 hypothetical protein SPPG_06294 [Spizellomyces punctatus DAOM BR117]|eukprot:XP_016606653.1 hypothetical protein SPPG_06294 [Spizellomyces punctatus DAOM BR117]
MARAEDYSTRHRLALVALGIFSALTTAGVIFGFQALRPALIDSHVYEDLCSPAEDKPCNAQVLRLNLMFAIASTGANLASLPIGMILDKYGPRATMLLGSGLFLLGSILFGCSNPNFDGYIIGYLLLGVGGPFCFIASLHISLTFPSHSGKIMAALTGAFDASSIIYLIFADLYKALGGSIQRYFAAYSVVPIVIVIATLLLMPKSSFGKHQEEGGESEIETDEGQPLLAPTVATENATELFWKQFKSPEFWGITSTICLFMLRLNFYISSIKEQLLDLSRTPADLDEVDRIVSYFNVALPLAGLVSIPAVGHLLDNFSFKISFVVLWIFGLSFGILSLVPNVPLQYLSVAIFVLKRPLLYTIGNDFCAKTFGFVTFGRLYGIMNVLAGLFSMLQYLFNYVALDLMNGHFWAVNLSLTVVTGLLLIFPIYLGLRQQSV